MSYETRILSLSPVLYMPFTETSGTTFADATGNGHDGTLNTLDSVGAGSDSGLITGEVSCVLGPRPLIDTFPGWDPICSYVSFDNPSTLPSGVGVYSYEFWAKRPDDTEIGLFVGDTSDYGDGVIAYTRMYKTHFTGLRADFGNFFTGRSFEVYIGFRPPECWHHYVSTWDGLVFAIYFDGVLLGTSSSSAGSVVGTPTEGFIANLSGDNLPVNHLALYDYVLTSTQVADNYAAATPRVISRTCIGLSPVSPPNQIIIPQF